MAKLTLVFLEQGFFSHIARYKQGQSDRIQQVVPAKVKIPRRLPEIQTCVCCHTPKSLLGCVYRAYIVSGKCLSPTVTAIKTNGKTNGAQEETFEFLYQKMLNYNFQK